jgi:glucose/mannose-6-phosphate isomerase
VEVPSDLQPRAAIGYLLGSVLGLLHTAGAVDDQRLNLIEAADTADEATREGSDDWMRAFETAESLSGRIPIVYGGGPISGAAAQRWKTQINENAKLPAWWSLLPELNHNEIVGWETMPEMTTEHLAIVPLTDKADHDRVTARFAHTRALTEDAVRWTGPVSSRGVSPLARLISLTAVGDLVSWMLAENAGVDPTPVATIEELKKLLVED